MSNQEVKKGWWPLVCAFFYLSFVPFLYMGKKCINMKWILYGVIHLVLIGMLFYMSSQYQDASWYTILLLAYWTVGMVHTYLNWEAFYVGKMEASQIVSNAITIVKPLDLYSKTGDLQGKLMKPIVYLLLPLWILGCITALGIVIFVEHNIIVGICSIIGLIMGIAPLFVLCGGGIYIPEKSFYLWRLSKDEMLKIKKYVTIGGVIIFVLVSLIDFKIQNILYLLAVLAAFYYITKSFENHEDVDYVTNNEVSDLLGMEIDEKIEASYQNFDPTSIKKGNNMMLITDKKLMFAYYDGEKWSMLNKKIGEIRKIGRINTDGVMNIMSTSCFIYVEFSDDTSIGLHMDLYDKITSNPDLFFKKFLITFDTFLLGKTDEKIASRRRVSINKESTTTVNTIDESVPVRAIDISNTILDEFRGAIPVKAGRVLEF